MKINTEVIQKIRKDNQLSLELALILKIPQATLHARIDRESKNFFTDVNVSNFLLSKGYSIEEIFKK